MQQKNVLTMETVFLLVHFDKKIVGHGMSVNSVELAIRDAFTTPVFNITQVCPVFKNKEKAEAYVEKVFEYNKPEIIEVPVCLGDYHSYELSLLDRYTKFLQKEGYIDTDATDEEPTAINEFLKTKQV